MDQPIRKTPTGGPAFPCQALNRENHMVAYTGMTLRDYIAIQAMQGFVVGGEPIGFSEVAAASYAMADSMLQERAAR